MISNHKKLIIFSLTAVLVMAGVLGLHYLVKTAAAVTPEQQAAIDAFYNPDASNWGFKPVSNISKTPASSPAQTPSPTQTQTQGNTEVPTFQTIGARQPSGVNLPDNYKIPLQIQSPVQAGTPAPVSLLQQVGLGLVNIGNHGTAPLSKAAATAEAANNQPSVKEIIGNIVSWLMYYIVAGFGWIIVKEVDVLLMIMSYPIDLSIPAVSNGWAIIRDVCNNFFIVILLAIAVGTILRVPSYRYKEALPKLLIAAVLINFSKLIAGIFIDVSQILMLSFAAPLVTIKGNNIILAALGLPDMVNFLSKDVVMQKASLDILNIITALIFGIIASLIAMVVIACIIGILIYRIVILLFLAILSPVPFFAGSFDKIKKYGDEWWQEFTKYLIVGPAMLFFLWISFSIMGFNSGVQANNAGGAAQAAVTQALQSVNTAAGVPQEGQGAIVAIAGKAAQQAAVQRTADTAAAALANNPQAETLSNLMSTEGFINFFFVIILLVMSLVMGQRFGGKASFIASAGLNFMDKQRKKITSLPGKAVGFGVKKAKQAGFAVGKGVLGTGLAVTRGLDAAVLGGAGAKAINAMRSRGGVVAGAALGTLVGGPVGTVVGAIYGGLIGKEASSRMTNWRRQKDSLLQAQGKGDKGKFLDVGGKEIKLSSILDGTANATDVRYQWDDRRGGYYGVDNRSFSRLNHDYRTTGTDKYKEDDGTVVHRWGEYKDSKGNSYRRYSETDNKYYRVDSAGEFTRAAAGNLIAASSELLGRLKDVHQMSERGATYYANYAASKSKTWAAADAAVDKKVSDAQTSYNRMSEEMLNKLIQTESDSTNKMAMALTLATKSGFKDFEKVLAAKQSFGGNTILLKKFNDEMNQRNMILNNTLAGGRLDDAAIAKLISSGKSDWHKQDPKQLNKAAIDLMARQLGHEFESNLEKLMKTDRDRKLVVSAMEQGLDARSFTDRDLDVRKAYAKASGNWNRGFTSRDPITGVVTPPTRGSVGRTPMVEAIKSIKSPSVFDDVSRADMADAIFHDAFASGISVKMLGQMMRSDKISSAKFRDFLSIIKHSGNVTLQRDITGSTNHDLVSEYNAAP